VIFAFHSYSLQYAFFILAVDYDENVGVFAEIPIPCGAIPVIKKLSIGMMLSY